jgi:hypothetical protein
MSIYIYFFKWILKYLKRRKKVIRSECDKNTISDKFTFNSTFAIDIDYIATFSSGKKIKMESLKYLKLKKLLG